MPSKKERRKNRPKQCEATDCLPRETRAGDRDPLPPLKCQREPGHLGRHFYEAADRSFSIEWWSTEAKS